MRSPLQIVSRDSVGEEAWNAFADDSDDAWLWHRFEMQEPAMSEWEQRRDLSFAVVDGDRLVATAPVQRVALSKRRVPWPILWNEGIAIENGLAPRPRQRLHAFALSHLAHLARKAHALEWRTGIEPLAPAVRGPRCPSVSPFRALDGEEKRQQVWIVDLTPAEDVIWQRLEGRARTEVRKAERAGVTVRAADAPADVGTYTDLYAATFGRTGGRALPPAYFAALWTSQIAAGRAFALVAELDDRPIAGQIFATYKQAGLYWSGAASDEALRHGTNSLLQWAAIQRMRGLRCEAYEVGEAMFQGPAKAQAISAFKKSLGGELYPVFNLWRASSRQAQVARSVEQLVKSIIGRR